MPNIKLHFTPILQALRTIDNTLTHHGLSQFILATPTLAKLNSTNPVTRIRANAKQRVGIRKAVRGRQHYQEPIMTLAKWPKDKMDENALPSLAYVINGDADFQIADYCLHTQKGDWVLFPAGIPKQDGSTPHFEGDPTGRNCDLLWFAVERTQMVGLRCWICHSSGTSHFSGKQQEVCCVEHRLLSSLFLELCKEVQMARREKLVKQLLATTITLLLSEIEVGRAASKWSERPSINKADELNPMDKAIQYIEDNIDQHLTIDILARELLVSRTTFTRYFRQHTGKSFCEYHNHVRVQRAIKLLTETNLPLTAICEKLGLGYGQLRLLIKESCNMTPGEMRSEK